MPLVEIEVIGKLDASRDELARAAADSLGRLFDSNPGRTWIRLRSLPSDAYAENGVATPIGTDAVFVAVLKRELPPHDELKVEAERIAEIVARIFGRTPERVHVLYEPPGAGRIAFGGKLEE